MRPEGRRRALPLRRPIQQGTSVRRHRPDYWLLMFCSLLLAIGLIVIYAISPALAEATHVPNNYFVSRQLLAIGLSIVAFIVTSRIPAARWQQFAKPLLIVAAAATLLALILPAPANYPAHRWVRLGSLSFQSVELLKFALLVWVAGMLAARVADGTINDVKRTLKPLGIALLVVGIIVAWKQSDLGSTGVMLMMMGSMAFMAGMPMRRILLAAVIVAFGVFLTIAATPYRRARLEAYIHPTTTNCSQLTNGYQACQAMIAVGSGGILGLGIGSSVQAYGYTPEAANDSIFAIFAEMGGFIGSLALLLIFGALFSRMAAIAERAPDDFSRLLVVGILSWLSIQALINIGAMIGLLPLKGITLPFISYGGTSVVFVAAAIGIVYQVSHYTSLGAVRMRNEKGRNNDDPGNGRRFRGAYHPDLSGRA